MGAGRGGVGRGPGGDRGCSGGGPGGPPALLMQGMGSLRLGSRAVMYTAETLPKGKNRVMGVSLQGKPLENPPSAHSREIPADPSGDAVSGEVLGLRHPPHPQGGSVGERGGKLS